MNLPWPAPLSATALADHLWQSTVFALAIWLLSFLLRNNQARIRYALWLAASFKFLLPFSLLITLGSLLPQPTHAVSATPTIYSAVDFATQPFAGWEPAPVARHTPTGAEFFTADLPTTLLALWITGALAVLLTWFIRWRSLNATLHHAIPTHAGRELRLLRRVEAALPARSPLPLRLSAELIEPGIFGIFRPVLVWPKRLTDRLEDEHIEAILTHELMHVRRRDNLTAASHMLVEAALWFHPLVWWIGRRLIDERERACDEAVVQLGGRAEAYAESLLKACRFCIESPLPCVSGITGADLAERVRSIMTMRASGLTMSRKIFLALVGFTALAVPVALGTVRTMSLYGVILHPTSPLPEFDVVDVKQDHGDSPAGFIQEAPDGIDTPHGVTLQTFIRWAYNIAADSQLSGGPGWIYSGKFDIKAKLDGDRAAEFMKLPNDVRERRLRLMAQALLQQRFKLKTRFSAKKQSIYELVVATGGLKCPRSSLSSDNQPLHEPMFVLGPPPPPPPAPSPMIGASTASSPQFHMKRAPLWFLATFLSYEPELNGHMVIDKTGVEGLYQLDLTWSRDNAVGSRPDLFAAIQEQLGLKLRSAKGAVEILTIDHVEQPSHN